MEACQRAQSWDTKRTINDIAAIVELLIVVAEVFLHNAQLTIDCATKHELRLFSSTDGVRIRVSMSLHWSVTCKDAWLTSILKWFGHLVWNEKHSETVKLGGRTDTNKSFPPSVDYNGIMPKITMRNRRLIAQISAICGYTHFETLDCTDQILYTAERSRYFWSPFSIVDDFHTQ